MSLPDMDGAEVLEALRRQSSTRSTPVIIHTSRSMTEQERGRLIPHVVGILPKSGLTREGARAHQLGIGWLRAPARGASPVMTSHEGTARVSQEPILLNINDNEANRYALTRMLRAAGFPGAGGGTGAEALRVSSEVVPDLVVLDVKLPDLNGIEVCRG
jgi:CheY-like chemotaxis protein